MSSSTPRLQDPAEFERVYNELRPRVYAAAQRILRDHAQAEDVVQDVFTQLWRKPRSFDEKRGSLRSYLTLVARSRAIDVWRSEQTRTSAVDRLGTAVAHDGAYERPAVDEVIRRETSLRLVKGLDEVPPAQREALLLTFGKQMTATEVASTLDIPVGTAKSRVRLGLSRMRETAEQLAA